MNSSPLGSSRSALPKKSSVGGLSFVRCSVGEIALPSGLVVADPVHQLRMPSNRSTGLNRTRAFGFEEIFVSSPSASSPG